MVEALFLLLILPLGIAVISLPAVAAIAAVSVAYTIYWHVRRRRPVEQQSASQKVKAGIIMTLILILYMDAIGSLLLLRP